MVCKDGGQEPLGYQSWPTDEELDAVESSEEDISLYSAEYRVYVIRDGAGTPIYIGQSRNAIERLQNHLALLHQSAKPSEVGAYILQHLPLSFEWQIDLYTREECLLATRRQVGCVLDGTQKKSIDDFERHLIWEFSQGETLKPHVDVALVQRLHEKRNVILKPCYSNLHHEQHDYS